MSRRCDVCGRGPQVAFSRSHSNVATKKRCLVNLQTKNISEANNDIKKLLSDSNFLKKVFKKEKLDSKDINKAKKIKICTRCLKTLKKYLPSGK
ncbi:50S ribosomal protein L28 [Patescibacteria group bacterium]|nr:50S ribosomal protein L28 [Patescibacteria group bacterium]